MSRKNKLGDLHQIVVDSMGKNDKNKRKDGLKGANDFASESYAKYLASMKL